MVIKEVAVASSMRDPAGYVYRDGGVVKRAVRERGLAAYQRLMSSGLYAELAGAGLLVRHRQERSRRADAVLSLVPEQIEFLSYPYEWCFSQLRDAALLTLEVQRRALRHGMRLKDASAYNVQFRGARPVFIDTLSFEENEPGPWVAYRQFCREFLGPLLLMAHVSETFNQYMAASPEGFPLELVSRLLPWKTYLHAGALVHVHLHARAGGESVARGGGSGAAVDRKAELAESLRAAVESLRLPKRKTSWSGYYAERTHYSNEAEAARREFVWSALLELRPEWVMDLGSNTGRYSRLAAEAGCRCVGWESDGACAEEAYLTARESHGGRVLPLRVDVRYPSPGLGMSGDEQTPLTQRRRAGLVMAMAFVHHLRITGNVPLRRMSGYLAELGEALVLEFVPKEDPMVREMLAHREDVFDDYTLEGLLEGFADEWRLEKSVAVPGSPRRLLQLRSVR
ncbi:MAG: SAM-dependent methyltransferase [Bryobacterales bacterium]|nr:SAM-dependent methyltransferase [Bryobacterales bacterium]